MIRILILLMALNSIFTPLSMASVCASDLSDSSLLTVNQTNQPPAQQVQTETLQVDGVMQHMSQTHCDHCNVDDMNGSMQSIDCASDCSLSCLSITLALTPSPSLALSQTGFPKPVSGAFAFYTRSISPELQPPLV